MISNVRILENSGENMRAVANFVVYRMRYELMDTYVGRYEYKLVRRNNELKIQERKVILDLEALRPHGKISFIL
jgi:p-cumate 2,3-dioxygenase beta subunit